MASNKPPTSISAAVAGSGTDKMTQLFKRSNRDFAGPFSNLSEAVQAAMASAEPGTSILLSPGCTSYGMFLNEFDRGTQFKEIVLSLLDRRE